MNKINKKTFLKQLCLLPFCGNLIKSKEKLYKSDFIGGVHGMRGWNNFDQEYVFLKEYPARFSKI